MVGVNCFLRRVASRGNVTEDREEMPHDLLQTKYALVRAERVERLPITHGCNPIWALPLLEDRAHAKPGRMSESPTAGT